MRLGRSALWMLLASLLAAALAFWILRPSDAVSPGDDTATVSAEPGDVEVQPRLEGQVGAPDPLDGATGSSADADPGGPHTGPGQVPGILLTVLTPEGKPVPRGFVNIGCFMEEPMRDAPTAGPEISASIGGSNPWRWGPEPRVAPRSLASANGAEEGWRHLQRKLVNGRVYVPHDPKRLYVLVTVRPEGEPVARYDKFARSRTSLLPQTVGLRFDEVTRVRSASITLERGLLIEGVVLDEDGDPADEAWIELRALEPRSGGVGLTESFTDRSGRFVFGSLDAAAYDLRAESLGAWGRVMIYQQPEGPVELQTGRIEGPHCLLRDGAGKGVRRGSVAVSPASVTGWSPAAPEAHRPVFLSPSSIGTDITVRGHGVGDFDTGLNLTWKFRVGEGEHVLTVPESREASVLLERADGEPFAEDTPWRELTLQLEKAGGDGASSASYRVNVEGAETTVRLPEGRYDLELTSSAAAFSSQRLLGGVTVPGENRIALLPRRAVRVRIVGASVHAARLWFIVDGTRLAPPAGARTTGPGEVMLEGLDAGAREVVAMLRSAAGTDNPNVGLGWPKDLSKASRRQVGRASLVGDEAVIDMREGACLRLLLPPGSPLSQGEPVARRRRGRLMLLIYDGEDIIHQALARPGPAFGYPEGELVSPPLLPGRYRVVVTRFDWVHGQLAVVRIGDAPRALWTVDGLVPGDAPHTLEPLTGK